MSVNSPRMVPVSCPSCRTQYTAPVQNVIDAGRDPRLKTMLLQGQLNLGVCPQCGASGMLGIPLVYHDAEKELLLCLTPQELHATENERQRAIGEMSNAIINSLTPDQRKGYLLQPRVFLTFQTLVEAILEADGITREMLQAQREKAQLVATLLRAVDDSLQLAALIDEHGDKIDYEFFALLTAQIDSARQSEQADTAERLTRLREVLLERTTTGEQVAKEQEAIEKALSGIDENLTREDLIERLIAIEGEYEEQILYVLVAMTRPLLDYRFFQLLTERLNRVEEEGNDELASRLKALRARVLDLAQKLDAQARARMQEKAQVLSEIVQSTDLKATIQARLDEIDDTFMAVLEANIAQSEQQHQHEAADKLRSVRNMIVAVLQESAPPTVRFINQLLSADYPNETRKMLIANQEMVTRDLLSTIDMLVQDLADRGNGEASERLKGIRAQAELHAQ